MSCTLIEFPILPPNVVRFPRRGVYAERETPVPCSEVTLDDGRRCDFLTENANGDYLVVHEGRTLVVDPARVLDGDGPGEAA